jgi:hypothetical protein
VNKLQTTSETLPKATKTEGWLGEQREEHFGAPREVHTLRFLLSLEAIYASKAKVDNKAKSPRYSE